MRYALIFSLLSLGWMILAVELRGIAWLLLWPAISNMAIAAAYAGLGPKAFGKRDSGTVSPLAFVMLFPYTILSWITWFVASRFSREPACTEVAPGLWIGRRCGGRELPEGIVMVVDLTCELWEPASIRRRAGYRCVPILDASICDDEEFRGIVKLIANSTGAVLVHCAQGHGRSACVAAGVLIARGLAIDARDAEERIARLRPAVRLKPVQHRMLKCIDKPAG